MAVATMPSAVVTVHPLMLDENPMWVAVGDDEGRHSAH
jgi:hypothetical protein